MAKKTDKITELESLAAEVLELKRQSIPRRPIVIEFCGSPKAGKSSCLNSLDIFLRRNGFRTSILAERASMCPVRSKFDPTFNVWTACMSLAQMCDVLSNRSKDLDVVLLDRGVFDAICWFYFQHKKLALDQENLEAFCDFFAARKWRSIIDLVYVFTATPRTSMDREYSTLLTRKTGSVMRPNVLDGLLEAISDAVERYKPLFRNVIRFDTTGILQNEVSYKVTKNILETLRAQISERIGYIHRKQLSHLNGEVFEYESLIKSETRNSNLRQGPLWKTILTGFSLSQLLYSLIRSIRAYWLQERPVAQQANDHQRQTGTCFTLVVMFVPKIRQMTIRLFWRLYVTH